mgnify:FL=1
MSTKNRTRRKTTRNIRFPNQMIEQINIALEQKGSGNFSAWVIEACRRRLTSEKRAYTSIQSDDGWTSRFLPPSHRKSDYEGNPASVSTVKPGVHRFWLFPHTHAEGIPRRATVMVNAEIRRRCSAWCVRLEYLYPLKGISVKLSRAGYKPLSRPLIEWPLQ